MIVTAENLARKHGFTWREQNEAVLLRYAQYQDALADDAAFQRRYMVRPLDVVDTKGRRRATIEGDEGVHATTAEGLAKLKPLREGGTVTYGHQTHPADGNCGMLVCEEAVARALAPGRPLIRLVSFAEGRADAGFMGEAPVLAAQAALDSCNLTLADIDVVKTHNPFIVNDLYFSKAMELPLERMNQFGSSLIYGHPQGPTGMRLVIEMIEELEMRGGGFGLFTGCAAGDSAAAIIVQVV
jgi:acetyl-CoA acetyltransferase